jgi:hypothetical protein
VPDRPAYRLSDRCRVRLTAYQVSTNCQQRSWRHILQQQVSIIAELEEAVRSGSSAKRISTLRQVTDLFLHDAQRLSEDQVKVFDDVLCHLVARVETRVKSELSARLASVENAPSGVIERLASDDQIEVAGTVLAGSSRLTTSTLVEIAKTKGQDHLLAISGRADLPEAVTDVIVDRGERRVIRNLAGNASARFSDTGYQGMVAHAESDDELTELLGVRIDLPIKFLRDLLQRATEAVRARLASIAPADLQEEIKRVLKTIATVARGESPPMRDFSGGAANERPERTQRCCRHRLCGIQEIRRSGRFPRHFQQQRADQHNDAAAGGTARGPHSDTLQISGPEPGRGRSHPLQPACQASYRRSNAETGIDRLREVVDGNRRTRRALLAASRQNRKVGSV